MELPSEVIWAIKLTIGNIANTTGQSAIDQRSSVIVPNRRWRRAIARTSRRAIMTPEDAMIFPISAGFVAKQISNHACGD